MYTLTYYYGMGIPSTCIGAFSKPDNIDIGNFSETELQGERLLAAPNCGLVMLDRELSHA